MFKKRKALVEALKQKGRVIHFTSGYVIVPTESDVFQVIKDLTSGVVRDPLTTLGVKNELRAQGFFATQSVISEFMHKMASTGMLTARDTGRYHVFERGSTWMLAEAVAGHSGFVR